MRYYATGADQRHARSKLLSRQRIAATLYRPLDAANASMAPASKALEPSLNKQSMERPTCVELRDHNLYLRNPDSRHSSSVPTPGEPNRSRLN